MIATLSLFLAVARADGAELTWLEGWLVLACWMADDEDP